MVSINTKIIFVQYKNWALLYISLMHCAIERIKKYYGYSLSATFFKSLKMCLTICEERSTYRLIKVLTRGSRNLHRAQYNDYNGQLDIERLEKIRGGPFFF